MYCMICTILRYDTIYTMRTLYRTIHEHLRYADMIRNFLHDTIHTYRTILTTMELYMINCTKESLPPILDFLHFGIKSCNLQLVQRY